MKRAIIIFVITLTILSCNRHRYTSQETINRWYGKNINAVFNILGYPENQITLPNGNIVYIFYSYKKIKHFEHSLSPVRDFENGKFFNRPDYYELSCTCFIEIDADNIIRNIKYKGNDCDSIREEIMEKRNANQ